MVSLAIAIVLVTFRSQMFPEVTQPSNRKASKWDLEMAGKVPSCMNSVAGVVNEINASCTSQVCLTLY